MTTTHGDPVDQLLEIGLKDLWYPICPSGHIKESPSPDSTMTCAPGPWA